MIAHPIGHLIGYPTRNPKGYPNRPRIARIGPSRIGPYRPLVTTRVETFHHVVGLGDAGARDGMMTASRQESTS